MDGTSSHKDSEKKQPIYNWMKKKNKRRKMLYSFNNRNMEDAFEADDEGEGTNRSSSCSTSENEEEYYASTRKRKKTLSSSCAASAFPINSESLRASLEALRQRHHKTNLVHAEAITTTTTAATTSKKDYREDPTKEDSSQYLTYLTKRFQDYRPPIRMSYIK
jgi:hypothetical protein